MNYARYDTVCLDHKPRLWIQCTNCKDSGSEDLLGFTFPYERKDHTRVLPLSSMLKHERRKHPVRKSMR